MQVARDRARACAPGRVREDRHATRRSLGRCCSAAGASGVGGVVFATRTALQTSLNGRGPNLRRSCSANA